MGVGIGLGGYSLGLRIGFGDRGWGLGSGLEVGVGDRYGGWGKAWKLQLGA